MFKSNFGILRNCEESKTPKPGNLYFSPLKVTSPVPNSKKIEKKPENEEKLSKKSLNFSEFVNDFNILSEDSTRTERIVEFKGNYIEKKEQTVNDKSYYVTKSEQNTSRHKKNAQSLSINFNDVLKLRKTISAQHSKESLLNIPEKKMRKTTKGLIETDKIKENSEFCLNFTQDFFQIVKNVYKSLKYKNFNFNSDIKEDILWSEKVLSEKSRIKGKILKYLRKLFEQLSKTSEKIVKIDQYTIKYAKPITFLQTFGLSIQRQDEISLHPIQNSDFNFQSSAEKLNFLASKNTELQHLLDKGKSDCSSLILKQKSLKSSEKFLQNNILLLREENLLLETELKSLKTTIGSLSQAFSKVNQKNSQQKRQISELVKIVKDFQKHEFQNDQKSLKSTKIIDLNNDKQNPVKRSEIIGSNKELAQPNNELNENLEILQSECRRLSNENQELRCTNEINKKGILELMTENTRLEKENVCSKEENKILTKSLSEAKNEKLRIQACLEKLQETYNEVKIENLAYKETIEILEKHCNLDSI